MGSSLSSALLSSLWSPFSLPVWTSLSSADVHFLSPSCHAVVQRAWLFFQSCWQTFTSQHPNFGEEKLNQVLQISAIERCFSCFTSHHVLQRILPQLKTLLTSKIRGSTQHLWCRTRANDFPPVSWRSAHLTPKSTLLTSAGNFSCNKSSEMSAVGSPKSQGLSQQDSSEPSSRWATKASQEL